MRFFRNAWLLIACAAAGTLAAAQPRTIDDFFRQVTDEWVRLNPNLAVSSRYFSGEEQDRYDRQLTSDAPPARAARTAFVRRALADLARFDRGRLNDVQRLSAELLQYQLQNHLDSARYDDYRFPFDQFNGANVRLVNALTVVHPMGLPGDAATYIARLRQVGPRIGEALTEAKALAGKDLIPPRFILTATITQMRRFIEPPASENPLVSSFSQRAAAIKDLPAAERTALVGQAEQIVAADVYPRWREAIALLESLVPRSADHAGLWRFEGGAAAYAQFLRTFTTTDLTPDAIHDIGLRDVARLEREMDALLRRIGRTEGSVKDRVAQLKKDLSYPLTEEGRRRIVADSDAMIRDSERRSALQFDRRPKSAVVAQPYPRFREANAAASYTPAPLDGSRPGIFQIPLRPERMTKFGLRTLINHETVPGHHFQIGLIVEDRSLPRFRQMLAFGGTAAITEGWALYAERLAAESGWYADDPEGLLGQMEGELFRARRLVVDTGLHAKRWTRQQAIDYGIEASEVERYVVNPGQACAYKIGQLKILELRDRAKAALKGRFSERAFHNAVLSPGAVPLDLLEREVDRYIRAAAN
jgi:uncharacterized protein (DUF885 family)